MKTQNIIEYLQNLKPQHKTFIIIVVVIASGLVLGNFWIKSLQTQIAEVNADGLLPQNQGQVLGAAKHLTVEFQQKKGNRTYVYFKVQNNTPNILTFSTLADISLITNKTTIQPDLLMDRQESVFPVKILSNTTTYGTLVFNDLSESEGVLTFDNLFFEVASNEIFTETIQVDLSELKPLEELRQ